MVDQRIAAAGPSEDPAGGGPMALEGTAAVKDGPVKEGPVHDRLEKDGQGARCEVYTHQSALPVYAMHWSSRHDKPFRLAVASFVEDYCNKVEIIQLDSETEMLVANPNLCFSHPYPPSKVMFIPDKEGTRPDLVATAGDFLRVWKVSDDHVELDRVLDNSGTTEFCAPLTSFDWNDVDVKRVGTCSIDTTCTVWDVERGVVDTQLIAHDREVYDMAWGGAGVFASVSADCSVRVFDLRDKEHSTIIYESPEPDSPLLHLAWNKQDPRYIAALGFDSPRAIVLDIRFPTLPVAELSRHAAAVNALAWAPHSCYHMCTAGDDKQALIWDLRPSGTGSAPAEGGMDPFLAYAAEGAITQLQWSTLQPEWIAICYDSKTQILRV